MSPSDLAAWAAVVVGAIGIFGAWRAYVVSRATRNDEIERDRRRQAAAVSSWMGYLHEPGREQANRCNAVMITNHSDSAIYDVVVRALVNRPRRRASSVPGSVPRPVLRSMEPERAQAVELLSDLATSSYVSTPYTRHPTSWRVLELSFTDGSGVRWRRGEGGCLVRVDLPTVTRPAPVDAQPELVRRNDPADARPAGSA